MAKIKAANNTSQRLYTIRRSKLNNIYEAIESIVAENFMACTQQELLFLINRELPPEQRLNHRGLVSHLFSRENEDRTTQTSQENPLYEMVVDMVILYRIQTKKDLLSKYEKAKSHITIRKYEFLLQRKFKEWAITDKSTEEASNGQVSVTINIVPRESINPITSESQMLALEEQILSKYADRLSIPTRTED